jgi:hypothetical protein
MGTGVAPEEKFTGFPNVKAWHERMTSRLSWINSMETRAADGRAGPDVEWGAQGYGLVPGI